MRVSLLAGVAVLAAGPPVQAQDMILLWVDTHAHTFWSVDAWSYGNFTIDAKNFRRGVGSG
jgi:hypothetical protein